VTTDPYDWINKSLKTIHNAGWYRQVKTIESRPENIVQVDGEFLLNFASNDYLGLTGAQRLIEAAIQAIQDYGTGTTGSRLITGHRPLHRQLEIAIARLKNTEDAIVFSSGYLANIGTIAALVGKRDLILSDQYNHSSLKNGAILSGATTLEYQHCHLENLDKLLYQHRHQYRRCLIITDSIFSMDGDICPIPDLIEIAKKYGCMLLLDEAHATGVLGATGAGCVEYFKCTGTPLIQIGTLSKALGSLGGYVAGTSQLIDFLRNRAASWIYTTGLSPADTAAALAAIQIIQQEPERRQQLWKNQELLLQFLIKSNLPLIATETPILCIPTPDVDSVLGAGEQLKKAGIFAGIVRPPTVPTSRIRITVMATHQPEHLQKLAQTLDQIFHKK
jgi:8-amino-7-oxononanoate synthase